MAARLGLAEDAAAQGKPHKAKPEPKRAHRPKRKPRGSCRPRGRAKRSARRSRSRSSVPSPASTKGGSVAPTGPACTGCSAAPARSCAVRAAWRSGSAVLGRRPVRTGRARPRVSAARRSIAARRGRASPRWMRAVPARSAAPTARALRLTRAALIPVHPAARAKRRSATTGRGSAAPARAWPRVKRVPPAAQFCTSGLDVPPSDWFDLPHGCCPVDRYFPDQWWGTGKYFCAQPEGPGSVWLRCD